MGMAHLKVNQAPCCHAVKAYVGLEV